MTSPKNEQILPGTACAQGWAGSPPDILGNRTWVCDTTGLLQVCVVALSEIARDDFVTRRGWWRCVVALSEIAGDGCVTRRRAWRRCVAALSERDAGAAQVSSFASSNPSCLFIPSILPVQFSKLSNSGSPSNFDCSGLVICLVQSILPVESSPACLLSVKATRFGELPRI